MLRVVLSSEGRRDYKKLSKDMQISVADRFSVKSIVELFSSLRAKKLQPPLPGYRVRVGEYRILFTLESDFVRIYRIKNRKDAYR